MKVLLALILSIIISTPGWAYLTAGKVAVTATSSSSGVPSTSQDSDISDTVGTSVSVGVPVGVTGDMNITGTYKVNGNPISSTSNWTLSGNNIYYKVAGGNVGIGTATPGSALDVQGTLRATTFLGAGASLVLLQSGTPSSVPSFTITGLATGVRYKLNFNFVQNISAGYYTLIFNADSGSNYGYAQIYCTAGTGAQGAGPSGITQNAIGLSLAPTATVDASTPLKGFINFESNAGIAAKATMVGSVTQITGSQVLSGTIGGIYTGSTLSSLTISTSAGTMTGDWQLYQEN